MVDLDFLSIEIPENSKFCLGCREYKSLCKFTVNKLSKDGKYSKCKDCRALYRKKNRERIEIQHKKWRTENPDNYKNSILKTMYGITLEEYRSKIKQQSGLCAICKNALDMGKRTHVDHCHETGKIRGILCNSCNGALGVYERYSEKMNEYLLKHSDVQENYKNYIPSHAFLN